MKRNAPITIVEDDAALLYEGKAPPGAAMFTRDHGDSADEPPRGLIFGCPCGCGQVGGVSFEGRGRQGPGWAVAGSWPNASLTPSIGFYGQNRDGTFHWHGYLTNGVFEEC
jgi:hypothetical protein